MVAQVLNPRITRKCKVELFIQELTLDDSKVRKLNSHGMPRFWLDDDAPLRNGDKLEKRWWGENIV